MRKSVAASVDRDFSAYSRYLNLSVSCIGLKRRPNLALEDAFGVVPVAMRSLSSCRPATAAQTDAPPPRGARQVPCLAPIVALPGSLVWRFRGW